MPVSLYLRQLLVSNHDKTLRNKLIKNLPFIRIQIRAPSFQYIAKNRDFLVSDESICSGANGGSGGGGGGYGSCWIWSPALGRWIYAC